MYEKVKEEKGCVLSLKEKREKYGVSEKKEVCIGTFHRSRKMEVAVELKTYILILKLK